MRFFGENTKYISKNNRTAVHILDYDEFNIYTSIEDVENYIESLISEGIEIKEEAYQRCIGKFGTDFKAIIDAIFQEEE